MNNLNSTILQLTAEKEKLLKDKNGSSSFIGQKP